MWNRQLHTGLSRIWVTLFFCSIMLKSCNRSGDMVLLRALSGSLPSERSKWRSLELLLARGRVRDPAACLTSTRLMLSLRGLPLVLWKRRQGNKAQLTLHSAKATGSLFTKELIAPGFCGDSCYHSHGEKSNYTVT